MSFPSFILFVASALLALSFAQGKCRDEPDGTFLPDPTSRSRFIFCSGGFEIIGTCDPGLEFDPFDRVCDVARGQPPPNQRDPCFGQRDGTFLPDPSSRQRFIYCSGGQGTVGTCNNGLEFDPIDGICDVAQIGRPSPPPVLRDPCWGRTDGTFLPDPSSRQRFFYCSGGQAVVGTCANGLEFDPIDSVCDQPQRVPTVPPPVTRPPVIGPPTRPPVIGPPTRPPVNRNPCIGQQDGTFLPHPDNRRMFIFCWAQEAIEGACEGNMEFDPVEGFCDVPQAVPRPPAPSTRAPPPTRPTTRATPPARPPVPSRTPPPVPPRVPPTTTRATPRPPQAGPPVPTRAPQG